jgi:hypothetical protein
MIVLIKGSGKTLLTAILIFILTFFVYFLSNPLLKDHYKHQVFLAFSLVQGRCDLVKIPSGHHDIFEVQGKYYTAFSPFPILFLVPWVKIFGPNTPQVLFSIIIGALSPVILYLILRNFKLSQKTIFLTIIAFSLGTLNWYAAVIGASWFFSHSLAILLLLFSLLYLFKKKLFLSGLFFSLAFASRYPVAAAIPAMFFLIKLYHPGKNKQLFKLFLSFSLGLMPGLFLCLFYNDCRFGNIFETGYQSANLFYSGDQIKPQFSLAYWPRNLYIFLFKGFDFTDKFPFLKPDPQGLSILFSSPFLLYAFLAAKKKNFFLPLWLAIISISLVVFSYFLTGWYQFGYRFLLDFFPFLIILVAVGLEKAKSYFKKYFLVSASIIFNLLGIYWAFKLGW